MSKGLEALKELKTTNWKFLSQYEEEQFNTIEKELKALVVLKDILQLRVYKNKLGQCFLRGMNVLLPISQEKYDFLKEVLLWNTLEQKMEE